MHACMYVFMYVCTSMYVFMLVYMNVYVYACMGARAHRCVCVQKEVHEGPYLYSLKRVTVIKRFHCT